LGARSQPRSGFAFARSRPALLAGLSSSRTGTPALLGPAGALALPLAAIAGNSSFAPPSRCSLPTRCAGFDA